MQDVIYWIEAWREKYCDRDWERANGIDISGRIDSSYDYLDDASRMVLTHHDWCDIFITGRLFNAGGDNKKLLFILNEFRRLSLEHGEDVNQPLSD